jgi:hypothetical protein
MAETDEKPDAKYVGLWEATVKGVNSLILHRERVVLDNEPWLEGREWKIAIRLAVLSSI